MMFRSYSVACLLLASLILSGCCGIIGSDQPHGIELNVSERLDPSVSVFVLDPNQRRITTVENHSVFFPQQSGLPEGTEYGFRVTETDGNLIMPAYESFRAKTPERMERDGMERGNGYYHNLQDGKYVLELLTIKNGEGTVVARMNFSSVTQESRNAEKIGMIRLACANVTDISNDASEEENRSYRSSMADCAAGAAIGSRDPGVCDMIYAAFNVPNIQDDCIALYAHSTGDISACDKASVPWVRGLCKAQATDDWTECTRITCDWTCAATGSGLDTHKDLCILNFAFATGNASLCKELITDGYKERCAELPTQTQ